MTVQPTPDDLDEYLNRGRTDTGLDEATRHVVDSLHRLASQTPVRDDFATALEQRLLSEATRMASLPSLSPWQRARARVFSLMSYDDKSGEGGKVWSTYAVTGLAALAVVLALLLLMRPPANQGGTLAAPTSMPPGSPTPVPPPSGTISIVGWPIFATPTPPPPGINVAPLAVPTAWAFEGRLGGPLITARSSAFAYSLHLCHGEVIPVYERTLNELRPFVGQEVRGVAGASGASLAPWLPDGPTILQISPALGVCPGSTPVPLGQPTPVPTGTPFTLTGHVTARVTMPAGGFAYLMTQCDGSDLMLTERTPGQLDPFVGQDVYLILATEWRLAPDLPRILPAYIALFVQPGPPCTAAVPAPVPLTETPETVAPPEPTLVPPLTQPTPWSFVGRLTLKLAGQGGEPIFLLQQCDGLTHQLYEATPGQLDPFVGQEVRGLGETTYVVTPTTGERGAAVRVISITAAPGACPIFSTPTPVPPPSGSPQPPPTALPLPTGGQQPLVTPLPVIAVGRLQAAESRPMVGTFYPFERCDGTVYWAIEGRPGLLAAYVGQVVRLYAEPHGIPSNPGEEPQWTVLQVEAAPEGCPPIPPTTTPAPPVAAIYDWLSPDKQWMASVSVGLPVVSGPNAARKPVQLKVRRTDGSLTWTVVDDFERGSGWLSPAPQTWTRDGRFLYYAFGFEVHRVDLATGQARRVALDVARVSQVSPDESKLAYIDWKMRLTVRDLWAEGVEQMVVPDLQDAAHVHDLLWAPDSRAVAFSYPTADGRQALIRVNLPPLTLFWQAHRSGSSLTLTGWPQAGEMQAKDDQERVYRVNAETGQVTSAQ